MPFFKKNCNFVEKLTNFMEKGGIFKAFPVSIHFVRTKVETLKADGTEAATSNG